MGAELDDRAEGGDGLKGELERIFGLAQGAEDGLMSA
jgi:hypothetical protein